MIHPHPPRQRRFRQPDISQTSIFPPLPANLAVSGHTTPTASCCRSLFVSAEGETRDVRPLQILRPPWVAVSPQLLPVLLLRSSHPLRHTTQRPTGTELP